MNLCTRNGLTSDGPQVGPARCGVRLGRCILAAVVCVAVIAGHAAAQQETGSAKAKPGSDQAKAATTKPSVAPAPGGCGSKAGPSRQAPARRQAREPAPIRPGYVARWVCPETKVTADPVWHGEQIECAFTIRNEGQGLLNIKAKGG